MPKLANKTYIKLKASWAMQQKDPHWRNENFLSLIKSHDYILKRVIESHKLDNIVKYVSKDSVIM